MPPIYNDHFFNICAQTNIDMSGTIISRITFGMETTHPIQFDHQTTLNDIQNHTNEQYGRILPNQYHIEFYSREAKKFLCLTKDIFTSKYNPFIFNPTQPTGFDRNWVELFIVDDSPLGDQINYDLSEILMDDISFDGINDTSSIALPCENTLNQGVLSTNDSDIDQGILDSSFDGIHNGLDGALLSPPFIQNLLNQLPSQNNISTNDPHFFDDTSNDLIHPGQSYDSDPHSSFDFALQSTSNESLPQSNATVEESDEDSIYPETNSQTLNEYELARESNDEIDEHSSRIQFSWDVQPKQKDHYLTNRYKIDDGSDNTKAIKKCKGGISYIQGIKKEGVIKKKSQVLPRLRIPPVYLTMGNINLLIYAVFEEIKDGIRIWYKNIHKGFLLHGQLNPDAEFFNPIKMSLNNIPTESNGDYKLKIYMITKRNKQRHDKEEIFRLDEQTTIQIHKAIHTTSSRKKPILPARLLCVLEINNEIDWNTIGLSNFIQPPIKTKKS